MIHTNSSLEIFTACTWVKNTSISAYKLKLKQKFFLKNKRLFAYLTKYLQLRIDYAEFYSRVTVSEGFWDREAEIVDYFKI